MDEDRRSVAQSGADDFLAKPCREEELLEKLRVLLNIAYDYEQVSAAEGQPPAEVTPALSAEKLGQLPRELVGELRNATLSGNKRLMDKLILKVREMDDAASANGSTGARRQVRIRCPDAIAGGSMPPVMEQSLALHGNIMIVDDNPANLKLLEDMLRQHGYEVRSFPRGRLALAAADQEPPDLILLDINMPEMNGYEVCEQLKSSARLSAIPVIFLSALNAIEDKVKGFRSGGVDYISKPFQFEEVQARVETHLKLRRAQQAEHDLLEKTLGGAVGALWELVQLTSPVLALRSRAIRDIVLRITKQIGDEGSVAVRTCRHVVSAGLYRAARRRLRQGLLRPGSLARRGADVSRSSGEGRPPAFEHPAVGSRDRDHSGAERGDRGAHAHAPFGIGVGPKNLPGAASRAALAELRLWRRFDSRMLDALEGYSPTQAEFEVRRLPIRAPSRRHGYRERCYEQGWEPANPQGGNRPHRHMD